MAERRGIGEFELIDLIRAGPAAAASGRLRIGIGDDAAVIQPEGAIAVSVDAAVDGVHFDSARWSPAEIAHKAIASALSDLAAMAAEPGEVFVTLAAPAELDRDFLVGLAEGVAEVTAAHGAVLAGGDVVSASVLSLSVTVIGHGGAGDGFVTRAGARPGQELVLTGSLGGAAAGLRLLERPELGRQLDRLFAAALIERQRRPSARFWAGQALARAGATAMIDVSDGLGADAGHLASASGVAIEIDAARAPIQEGVAELAEAAGLDPLELALSGGEDYELLAALPAGAAAGLCEPGRFELRVIGRIAEGEGVRITGPDGREIAVSGHDHLG